MARDDQLFLGFVVPTKGWNVVVVAKHDAGLARRGLRRQAAVGARQDTYALFVDPLFQVRHPAIGHGLLDVPVAQAVDLEHDQALGAAVGVGIWRLLGAAQNAAEIEGILFVERETPVRRVLTTAKMRPPKDGGQKPCHLEDWASAKLVIIARGH